MENTDQFNGLHLRFQCVMVTVDGRPWIEGEEVRQRVASTVERAVTNRGGCFEGVEIHPDCIVFTYSSDGVEKPTSYMRAIRDEVKDEFGEEGPATMGKAQLSRGYFSRSDYSMRTIGEVFQEDYATDFAERVRNRCIERDRLKLIAKEARRRECAAKLKDSK